MFTMDSFGWNCPTNWQEIVDWLNTYAANVTDPDELNQIWEDYCNGDLPGAPEPIYKEDGTND